MAKVKGLFGTNLRGSIGKVTFRMNDRKNIASQKSSSSKKSASEAQIYQRAVANTSMRAYSMFKSICNHSFEGAPYGAVSMSKFLKYNNDMLRGLGKSGHYVGKNSAGSVAPNPYVMSKGSLAEVLIKDRAANDDDWLRSEFVFENCISNPVPLDNLQNYTVRMFLRDMRMEIGDQLTICGVITNNNSRNFDEDALNPSLAYSYFELSRYVFDEDSLDSPLFKRRKSEQNAVSTDVYELIVDEDVLNKTRSSVSPLCLVAHRHKTGTFVPGIISSIVTEKEGDGEGNVGVIFSKSSVMMCTAIVSRKQGSNWLRSDASMKLNKGLDIYMNWDYDRVKKSYELTGVDTDKILDVADSIVDTVAGAVDSAGSAND